MGEEGKAECPTSKTTVKMWGSRPYWGLGQSYDPVWVFTDEMKELEKKLIEVCRTKIRPYAAEVDKNYIFPRKSLEAVASLGLLGLLVPQELGGMGQSLTCASMVSETIARYGCPATAMVFAQHQITIGNILCGYHDNPFLRDLLSRLDSDVLIGGNNYSDPGTASHIWFQASCKMEELPGGDIRVLKHSAWCTSSGFADFYTSTGLLDDYNKTTILVVLKDEIRANTSDWSALGMHGNHSGPMIVEGVFPKERIVTRDGLTAMLNGNTVFIGTIQPCYTGIAMAAIDIAKRHVTRKRHADTGMRVCDYPTIQDAFGGAIAQVNSVRLMMYSVSQAIDSITDNMDFRHRTSDPKGKNRLILMDWQRQVLIQGGANCEAITRKMMEVCGGTGYKTELGIERLLRDCMANLVMSVTPAENRLFIGQQALTGITPDLMSGTVDKRLIHVEVKKMTVDEKKQLVARLQQDIALEDQQTPTTRNEYQGCEFDNPFATAPVRTVAGTTDHPAGLNADTFTPLKLVKRTPEEDSDQAIFHFALPNASAHTGCLPGQYVQVRVMSSDGKHHDRYMSPLSRPDDYGKIEIGVRFETNGVVSNYLQSLNEGDTLLFRGPMGGFEYKANTLDHVTMICAGIGATPAIQILRCIMHNRDDKTNTSLLYHAKDEDHFLCKREIDQYLKADQRLKAEFTVDDAGATWTGREGLFDMTMLSSVMPPADNGGRHKIVVCGGSFTATLLVDLLREMGYKSQDIFIYGALGAGFLRLQYGKKTPLSTHTADA